MNDPEKDPSYVNAMFLLRYLQLAGIFPDINDCPSCGRPFDDGCELFFCPKDAEFLCHSCRREGDFRLTAGGVSYIRHTGDLIFEEACRIRLDRISLSSLEGTIYAMIRSAIGEDLKSLSCLKDYS